MTDCFKTTAPNAVATVPASTHSGTAGYFKNFSSCTSQDGTPVTAEWFNNIIQNLEAIVSASGVDDSNCTDVLLRAISELIADATATDTFATQTTATSSGTDVLGNDYVSGDALLLLADGNVISLTALNSNSSSNSGTEFNIVLGGGSASTGGLLYTVQDAVTVSLSVVTGSSNPLAFAVGGDAVTELGSKRVEAIRKISDNTDLSTVNIPAGTQVFIRSIASETDVSGGGM